MIAYKIQLWYVIRDKFSPRQNLKILSEKDILGFCLGFPVRFLSCLGQIDAYHH